MYIMNSRILYIQISDGCKVEVFVVEIVSEITLVPPLKRCAQNVIE